MNRIIIIMNLMLCMTGLSNAQDVFSVNDYANFARYESANAQLKQSGKSPKVVFMGNSITEGWVNMRPAFFKDNNFVGRGIGGQVSHQMLLRFQVDVIDLKPEVVVILAGTNDLAQNSGPVTISQIMDNIRSMATLANGAGIKVVLCSVLPALDFPWSSVNDPVPLIIELNGLIKEHALANNYIYVDYYSSMVDSEGGLKVPEYTSADDLVHPNVDGYKVMEKTIMKDLKGLIN